MYGISIKSESLCKRRKPPPAKEFSKKSGVSHEVQARHAQGVKIGIAAYDAAQVWREGTPETEIAAQTLKGDFLKVGDEITYPDNADTPALDVEEIEELVLDEDERNRLIGKDVDNEHENDAGLEI